MTNRINSSQDFLTDLTSASFMRGTNNSMGAFYDDQAPEYQRDDQGHLTSEALPFSSSNKMAPEEEISHPTHMKRSQNPFRHSQRTFWIVIQDIEATEKFHKHDNYKHRDAKASIRALDRLIHQYNLQHKNKAGVICRPSGEGLRKILQSIWGPRKSENVQPSKTIWLASKRDWNSDYLRMIEYACKELTSNDKSLPVYDPVRAEPFNTDAGWHGEEKGSLFGILATDEDEHRNAIAGAKAQGDLKTYMGQTALDSITVSPMIVASPLTSEFQRSHRKSSPKVCLQTLFMITGANTACILSEWRHLQTKIGLVDKSALPMLLELRHPT